MRTNGLRLLLLLSLALGFFLGRKSKSKGFPVSKKAVSS
jgi:hypothetical protein